MNCAQLATSALEQFISGYSPWVSSDVTSVGPTSFEPIIGERDRSNARHLAVTAWNDITNQIVTSIETKVSDRIVCSNIEEAFHELTTTMRRIIHTPLRAVVQRPPLLICSPAMVVMFDPDQWPKWSNFRSQLSDLGTVFIDGAPVPMVECGWWEGRVVAAIVRPCFFPEPCVTVGYEDPAFAVDFDRGTRVAYAPKITVDVGNLITSTIVFAVNSTAPGDA